MIAARSGLVAVGFLVLSCGPSWAQGLRIGDGLQVVGFDSPRLQKELQWEPAQVEVARALSEWARKETSEAGREYAQNRTPEGEAALRKRSKEIDEACAQRLAELLKPEQRKRLREIACRQLGTRAFRSPAVQEALKLSDEQKSRIEMIFRDAYEQMARVTRGDSGLKRAERDDQALAIDRAMTERMLSVLSDEQKATWEGMLGRPN